MKHLCPFLFMHLLHLVGRFLGGFWDGRGAPWMGIKKAPFTNEGRNLSR